MFGKFVNSIMDDADGGALPALGSETRGADYDSTMNFTRQKLQRTQYLSLMKEADRMTGSNKSQSQYLRDLKNVTSKYRQHIFKLNENMGTKAPSEIRT